MRYNMLINERHRCLKMDFCYLQTDSGRLDLNNEENFSLDRGHDFSALKQQLMQSATTQSEDIFHSV